MGEFAVARSHVDAAHAHRARYGENYLGAEIDRLEALLGRHEGASADIVERLLIKALDTARRQSARLLELRAAATLGRVLAERNERHKAVDLLAPLYGWFTEGFDTADLKDAAALLAELA